MRAVVLRHHAIDGLSIEDHPVPEPAGRQVLVRVRAVSLNYRDILIAKGVGRWLRPLPLVPLSDAAAEVVALGAGTSRWRVGARVCTTFFPGWLEGERTDENDGPPLSGMLAEYRALDEDCLVRAPNHLSDVEASTLPCAALTAWHALFGGETLRPGDTVVVLGTGGVSLFALQFAVISGARVIATTGTASKTQRLRELGAEVVIDYRKQDWPAVVRAVTSGEGADHVIDVVGSLAQAVEAIRLGGAISVIGMLGGFGTQVDPAAIMAKSARIRGVQVGSRGMFEAMNRAITQHALKPVVDRVFPLEQAAAALRWLEEGAHFGKVCIQL